MTCPRSLRLAGPAAAAAALVAGALLAAGPAVASPAGASPAALSAAKAHWRVIRSFVAHNTTFDSVAALPDGSAWFGGESPASKPLLEHLSKGKWHSNSLPGPVGSFVGTVSATSDSNVWLDESGATAAVGHLTKHGWATRSFAIGTDDVLMDTLVTTGPKNTWVLDYDFTTKIAYAYHNTGSASWKRLTLPAHASADSAISASSARNIWVVGNVGASGTWATLRYNGKKWQVVPLPANLDVPKGNFAEVEGILAVSPASVFVTVLTSSKTKSGPIVLLHWNGHSWRRVFNKLPAGNLRGPIAPDGGGGIWLAGSNTAVTKGELFHYARGRWSTAAEPATSQIMIVGTLALIPGTRSLYGAAEINPAFGDSGARVLRYGG